MGIGQGFSVKGKETKGRTGSTRKVVDILANVAMQREKLIVRGEKNIVAQALVGLAQASGCRFVTPPQGLFGWVETGVDTDVLAQRMLDEGYLLAPGALFHADRAPSSLMRINFATTQEPLFWSTLQRLCAEQ